MAQILHIDLRWGGGSREATDGGGKLPRPKRSWNTARARQQRQDMSLPEVLLWNLLRKSPDGVHFRRQEGMANYVLDFYCAKAKVCIEIDGIAHDMGDRPERDQWRDQWLAEQGIKTLRIPATEVLKSSVDVAESILRYCQRRFPSVSP